MPSEKGNAQQEEVDTMNQMSPKNDWPSPAAENSGSSKGTSDVEEVQTRPPKVQQRKKHAPPAWAGLLLQASRSPSSKPFSSKSKLNNDTKVEVRPNDGANVSYDGVDASPMPANPATVTREPDSENPESKEPVEDGGGLDHVESCNYIRDNGMTATETNVPGGLSQVIVDGTQKRSSLAEHSLGMDQPVDPMSNVTPSSGDTRFGHDGDEEIPHSSEQQDHDSTVQMISDDNGGGFQSSSSVGELSSDNFKTVDPMSNEASSSGDSRFGLDENGEIPESSEEQDHDPIVQMVSKDIVDGFQPSGSLVERSLYNDQTVGPMSNETSSSGGSRVGHDEDEEIQKLSEQQQYHEQLQVMLEDDKFSSEFNGDSSGIGFDHIEASDYISPIESQREELGQNVGGSISQHQETDGFFESSATKDIDRGNGSGQLDSSSKAFGDEPPGIGTSGALAEQHSSGDAGGDFPKSGVENLGHARWDTQGDIDGTGTNQTPLDDGQELQEGFEQNEMFKASKESLDSEDSRKTDEQDKDGGLVQENVATTNCLIGMTECKELRADAPVFIPRFDLGNDGSNEKTPEIKKPVIQKNGNRAGSGSRYSNNQKKRRNRITMRDDQRGRGEGMATNKKFPVDGKNSVTSSCSNTESKQNAGKRDQRNRNRNCNQRRRPRQNKQSNRGKSSNCDEEDLCHQSYRNLDADSLPVENVFPALGNAVHESRILIPSVWASMSSDHLIFQSPKEIPSDKGMDDEFASLGLQRLSHSKKNDGHFESCSKVSPEPSGQMHINDFGDDYAGDGNEEIPSGNHPSGIYQKPKWNMNRLRDRWWQTLALQRLHRDLVGELKQYFSEHCKHTDNSSDFMSCESGGSCQEPVEFSSTNHTAPNELCFQESWVTSLEEVGTVSSQTEGILKAIRMNDEKAIDAFLFSSKPVDHLQVPFRSVVEKALFSCIEQDKPHLLRIVLRHLAMSMSPTRMKKQEALEAQVSPLMMAAGLGHNQCLAILLASEERHTSTLSSRDFDGNTVFHYCCHGDGDEGSLRLLLKELSSGTRWKQQVLSKLLLARNRQGKTSLHVACENGKDNLVQTFLSLCSSSTLSKLLESFDNMKQTPLLSAVRANQASVVSSLIMWRGNNRSIIWKKVSQSHTGDTETMKRQESDSSPCALVWAAKNGVIDMIHLLLQFSSVSGSIFRVTEALFSVIQSQALDEETKSETTRALILAGANPFSGFSSFHGDSSSSDVSKVETPIGLASKSGATLILQTLVEVGRQELQIRKQKRRLDPKLQNQPESYFVHIEAAEDNEVQSSLTNALIESLFYGWYHRETSLGFQHLSSAITLYKLGAELSDIGRLWKSMQSNSMMVNAQPLDNNQPRCFATSYEHPALDERSHLSCVSDTDRTLLAGYSKTLYNFGWMKDQLGQFGCSCPWISRQSNRYNNPENDKVFLVVRDGEKFGGDVSILSNKSEKLASAIRFATMKDDVDRSEIPEVFVDIDGRMMRYLLQHIYHGSVFTGWPTNEEELFKDLLELVVVGEENICPSLVQECEMRLLSSNPTQCFCWSCSKTVRPSPENPCYAECIYFVEAPGPLITGNRSLDVLAVTEFISGVSGLQLGYIIRMTSCSNTRYTPASQVWEKLDKTWKANRAIQLLKDQAIMTILLRFNEVIECESFQESIQYNANLAFSSKLHQMHFLETCLEEFHQSSLLCGIPAASLRNHEA